MGDTRNAAPSERVVLEVAKRTDRKPTEMPPLFETIDPEALDRLFRSEGVCRTVFRYDGHEVTVSGSDRIAVREVEDERSSGENGRIGEKRFGQR